MTVVPPLPPVLPLDFRHDHVTVCLQDVARRRGRSPGHFVHVPRDPVLNDGLEQVAIYNRRGGHQERARLVALVDFVNRTEYAAGF